MIKQLDETALGQVGSIFVTGTSAVTIPAGFVIVGIFFYEDTKLRVLTKSPTFQHSVNEGTARKEADTDSAQVFAHPQGTTKLGRYTAIQLHDGACELYLSKELAQ